MVKIEFEKEEDIELKPSGIYLIEGRNTRRKGVLFYYRDNSGVVIFDDGDFADHNAAIRIIKKITNKVKIIVEE